MPAPDEGSGQPDGPVPFQPLRVGSPGHELAGAPPGRRGRALERATGILLGIVLGVGVVTAFVFLGSETTIDAPRISGVDVHPRSGLPLPGGRIPTVRAVGGAPPPAGPARLQFERGETVRFRILSDAPIEIEIPGYGVRANVDTARVISFRADRAGAFPVVVSASHIGIATLRVTR